MKKYFNYFLLPALLLMSCSNQTDTSTGTTRDTDTLRVQKTTPKDSVSEREAVLDVKSEKKLRYLYAANGGLIGFFDDGSVSGCPRCDMIKENVATLYETPPHARYEAHKDYLLMNGDRMDFYETGKLKQDWVLFDYKWTIDVFPRK